LLVEFQLLSHLRSILLLHASLWGGVVVSHHQLAVRGTSPGYFSPVRIARMSDSRNTSRSSPSSLNSVPPYLAKRTRSPTLTSIGARSPLSSTLPAPTAITSPSWGFSLAVSGITIPDRVTSSFPAGLTTTRSPTG